MTNQFLKDIFDKSEFFFNLDRSKEEKFCTYLKELQKWNKKINLTSIKNDSEIIEKLFLDSVFFLKFIDIKPEACCLDVGSGGGFPGIPFKILIPEIKLTLLEPIKKKASFLKHITRELSLENINIENRRLEDISADESFWEKFDIITTRAIAINQKFLKNCLNLLGKNSIFIYFSGNKGFEGFDSQKIPFKNLRTEEYKLPSSKTKRKLLIFYK